MLQLESSCRARLKRHAEARSRRLLDRAVGSEGQHLRLQVVGGEELLGHQAGARPALPQQPGALAKLGHRHGAAGGERVVGRGDQHDRVLHEGLARQLAAGRRPAGYRHVELVVRDPAKHLLAVTHLERQVELGVQGREVPHQGRDYVLGGRRDRCDPKLAVYGCGRFPGGALSLVEQADHVGGVRREGLAGGPELDVAAHPLSQLDAELL